MPIKVATRSLDLNAPLVEKALAEGHFYGDRERLHVNVAGTQCVVLDKDTTGLNLVAH